MSPLPSPRGALNEQKDRGVFRPTPSRHLRPASAQDAPISTASGAVPGPGVGSILGPERGAQYATRDEP